MIILYMEGKAGSKEMEQGLLATCAQIIKKMASGLWRRDLPRRPGSPMAANLANIFASLFSPIFAVA